ncbi:hypothetical protein [Streptomyces sp. XD-27]|uniref:hypothetical protein n=1 Tax=Streptomyces sp. XD-27 TaxID=3062779 RepID=UPI0026F47735|nr:hypothetical protein [Streptomyces sp. XD-27]WKX70031.1 hypothetical protein Q3Y56_09005 [Streptomyces sp. XD-27]
MTVDPVLALVALLAPVAVTLLARFTGRRPPGPLCRADPSRSARPCTQRCPACTALTKERHR